MMRMKGASVRNRSSAMPAVWVLLELLIFLLLTVDHSTKFVECVHVPEGFVPSIDKELLPAATLSPQFSDSSRLSFEGNGGINRRMLRKRPPKSYPPVPTMPAFPALPSAHPPPPPARPPPPPPCKCH